MQDATLMNIINAYGTQYFSKELPFVQRCCVHVTQHFLFVSPVKTNGAKI